MGPLASLIGLDVTGDVLDNWPLSVTRRREQLARSRGNRPGSQLLPSRLIPHRHRSRAELQPAHELQVDTLREPREQRRPVAR